MMWRFVRVLQEAVRVSTRDKRRKVKWVLCLYEGPEGEKQFAFESRRTTQPTIPAQGTTEELVRHQYQWRGYDRA